MISVTDTRTKRTIEFDGERLSHSDTKSSRPRWSEIDVYRTTGGKYVLVKTGKTLVYHDPSRRSCAGPEAVEADLVDEIMAHPGDELVSCAKCAGFMGQKILLEADRVTVVVADAAEGLVESAHTKDGDEVVFLPYVAQRALEAAAEADPKIRDAYYMQRIA